MAEILNVSALSKLRVVPKGILGKFKKLTERLRLFRCLWICKCDRRSSQMVRFDGLATIRKTYLVLEAIRRRAIHRRACISLDLDLRNFR